MGVRISVLMSVYIKDDAGFFEEALESVFSQADKLFQMVLVCDGKITPEQDEIIARYTISFSRKGLDFKNPRLKENGGLGEALQFGSRYCRGDYIARMDSDDICSPDRFEKTHLLISKFPSADVIGAQIEEFKKTPGDLGVKRIVPTSTNDIFTYSKLRNPMNHVSTCIKRESLEAVNGYEHVLWHEDYYLWVKMLDKGMELINSSDVNVFVRVHDIGGRRSGLAYLKSELNFLNKCYELGFFSTFNTIRYITPRVFIRFLPSRMLSYLYRFLRCS